MQGRHYTAQLSGFILAVPALLRLCSSAAVLGIAIGSPRSSIALASEGAACAGKRWQSGISAALRVPKHLQVHKHKPDCRSSSFVLIQV